MLIPAIDLHDGHVVQLIQGERVALSFDHLEPWLERFASYSLVQVVDLDAARGRGSNDLLVARACAALPCRVGGGIRRVEQARRWIEAGAREVIVGSALFGARGVDTQSAERFSRAVGLERLTAAIDSRGGRVAVRGWQSTIPLTPIEAVRALEPFVGGFLYTIVDGEGLMQGIDLGAVRQVRDATMRRLTAAGGIRSRREVDLLHGWGVDAVVGMALYSGGLDRPESA